MTSQLILSQKQGQREEGLEIENEEVLKDFSELLGLDQNNVSRCLLTRRAKAGQDERLVLSLKLDEVRNEKFYLSVVCFVCSYLFY